MGTEINLRLKELRKIHGYTQKQVADILGVGWQTVLNQETGKRECNYSTLLKYSQLYHCSIDTLLGVGEAFSPAVTRTVEAMVMMTKEKQLQVAQFAEFLLSQK